MTSPFNSAKDTQAGGTNVRCTASAIAELKSGGQMAMNRLIEILVDAVVKELGPE